jgi:hypothetical protein
MVADCRVFGVKGRFYLQSSTARTMAITFHENWSMLFSGLTCPGFIHLEGMKRKAAANTGKARGRVGREATE